MVDDDDADAVRQAIEGAARRADAVADAGQIPFRERVATTVRRTFGLGDRYVDVDYDGETFVYDRENHDAWVSSTVAFGQEDFR